MAVRLIKQAFSRHPVISNAIAYGGLYVGAEFSQQILVKKIFVNKGEEQPINKAELGRYLVMGSGINSNLLYFWYKWLDRMLPGTDKKTIVKKLLLDQFLFTPPLFLTFYVVMSCMEGKTDILAEARQKLGHTFLTSCFFWLPAQAINFLFLPPAVRVVYLGACAFFWVNILCYFKRRPSTVEESSTMQILANNQPTAHIQPTEENEKQL